MNHRPLISASTAVLSALALFLTGCAASSGHDKQAHAARVALVTANGAPAGNAMLRELPGGGHRVIERAGLGHHLEVLLRRDERPQSGADHGVVVDKQ
ncbi:MAG: hypothetical protein RSC66_09130, partial [Comamonas sp.]